MGYQYQNVCYPDQQTARVTACAQFDAKTIFSGDLITAECVSTDFTGPDMTLCKRTNGGTCATVSQPWPITATCDHDGGVSLAYDWFLASMAFFCIVYGSKRLMDLFDKPHIES